MKLMQWVKIAHSFLQSVLNLFHFSILSLPTSFYICLSKNSSKPVSKNGEIGRLIRSLLIESFQLTLKFHSFTSLNMKVHAEFLFIPNITA